MNIQFNKVTTDKAIVIIIDNTLCFTAQEANSTIKLQNVAGTYQTSTTNMVGSWNDYKLGTVITLSNIGDKVYFKAKTKNDTCWNSDYNSKFIMTGKIAASGNVQSLLDQTCVRKDVPYYCYGRLFLGCKSLTSAPELPATTLSEGCYSYMFYGCTSLTQAPELPATTLANNCYSSMFNSCTSLIKTPELSTTILVDNCYGSMFYGCTSLTQVSSLPAITLADGCYDSMFYGCTSLKTTPTLPATTMNSRCYKCMFMGCTSLTKAPVLPAKTLATNCYYEMFMGCKNLKVSWDGGSGTLILSVPGGTSSPTDWGYWIFKNTGGSYTGTALVGRKYYCYS